jgi:hypothetical protein
MNQVASRSVEIPLAQMRLDGGTQPRASIDAEAVKDYADAMREGAPLPAVTLFYDGTDYWLADGFHRIHAARQVGFKTFAADVQMGAQRDAILYAVGANSQHGKRRSNEDKRRAVELLLRDAEWVQWSDNKIAQQCAVSQPYVGHIREKLGLTSNVISQKTYVHNKSGKPTTMKTGNIGKGGARSEVRTDVSGYEGMPVTVTHPAPRTALKPKAAPTVEVEAAPMTEPEAVTVDSLLAVIREAHAALLQFPTDTKKALALLEKALGK